MILLQENNLLGLTRTCKEYFSSIVKGLSKIAFHHFKHLHLGLISFALIHCVSWTCKTVTIKLNYELLSSQVKLSFKISLNSFRISPHLLASSQKLLCRIMFDYERVWQCGCGCFLNDFSCQNACK
jgi:MFS superfamily sulfate permease-like transporter